MSLDSSHSSQAGYLLSAITVRANSAVLDRELLNFQNQLYISWILKYCALQYVSQP